MIDFKCSACGAMLQTTDDRAGRSGRCKVCGAMVTVPAAPETDSGRQWSRLRELYGREAELASEIVAFCAIEEWNESQDRILAIVEAVREEDDPDRVRELIYEWIEAVGPATAARAVRGGRRLVIEMLLRLNDQNIEFMCEHAPTASVALRRLRSSPQDEAFVEDIIPAEPQWLDAERTRLDKAYRECKQVWGDMTADEGWMPVIASWVKGAVTGYIAGATLGLAGVILSVAKAFAPDEEDSDPTPNAWDAAVDELLEASDSLAERLGEALPSLTRSVRYVLDVFNDRCIDAILRTGLGDDELARLVAAQEQAVAEAEQEYEEFQAQFEEDGEGG